MSVEVTLEMHQTVSCRVTDQMTVSMPLTHTVVLRVTAPMDEMDEMDEMPYEGQIQSQRERTKSVWRNTKIDINKRVDRSSLSATSNS